MIIFVRYLTQSESIGRETGRRIAMGQNLRTLIKTKGVFTGYDSDILPEAGIIVNKDRIEVVGSLKNLLQREDDQQWITIDLCDHYVFPGLINAHVHLTFSGGLDPLTIYLSENEEAHLMRAIVNAHKLLLSGVTTARDCGSGWGVISPLNAISNSGVCEIPHLILCGPPLTPTGGHLHFMRGEADNAQEVRKMVRRLHKKGAKAIKIMVTGGQMTPGTLPEHVAYTSSEIATAVEEAERLNLMSVAHCLTGEGIRVAARAGVKNLDHSAFFIRESKGRLERCYDAEVAREVANLGVRVTMGLSAGYHVLDRARSDGPRTSDEAFYLEQEKRMMEIFFNFAKLGIPVVVGTDAGIAMTSFNETYLEITLMVKAGLSPVQAIQGATVEAARGLGAEKNVGSIAVGRFADLVAMPNNPLQDIQSFQNIDWVLFQGHVVRDERKNNEK